MTHAARLAQQMAFIVEIDQLKRVLRRTSLVGNNRRENTAEHSWHIAVTAMVLAEYSSAKAKLTATRRAAPNLPGSVTT